MQVTQIDEKFAGYAGDWPLCRLCRPGADPQAMQENLWAAPCYRRASLKQQEELGRGCRKDRRCRKCGK
jgi:hypothetical protein